MAFAWYSREIDPAFEGMIADNTIKNIDSYVVEEEAGLEAGDPVVLGTEENQVRKAETATAGKVIGAVIHMHKEPSTPYYPQYHTVGIMTMGDIYVRVGEDVKAGEPACLMADTMKWGKTGTAVNGAFYYKGADKDDLAILRLRNVTVAAGE